MPFWCPFCETPYHDDEVAQLVTTYDGGHLCPNPQCTYLNLEGHRVRAPIASTKREFPGLR